VLRGMAGDDSDLEVGERVRCALEQIDGEGGSADVSGDLNMEL
jgi:hypothetical protein